MFLYFHPDSLWQLFAEWVASFLVIAALVVLLYFILYRLLKQRLDKKKLK